MTDLSMWDDQVAELKSTYRILRYDQRGHGGTQATDGPNAPATRGERRSLTPSP